MTKWLGPFFLFFSILANAQDVPICKTNAPGPCKPSAEAAAAAESKAEDLMRQASDRAADLENLKDNFVAIRKANRQIAEDGGTPDPEPEYAALRAYRTAHIAQDQLYQQVIDLTLSLYHLKPRATKLTVAKPTDPKLEWMSGLQAKWKPGPVDSGPNQMFAFKVFGSDGDYHYGGLTSMDPTNPDPNQLARYAITLPDGRVLILKGTVELALEKQNLGFLGSVLYHEIQHYDALQRPSGGKKKNSISWTTPGNDEKMAYSRQDATHEIFDLSERDERDIEDGIALAQNAIDHPATDSYDKGPATNAAWEDYYSDTQVNLSEEYARLKKEVAGAFRKRDQALLDRLSDIALRACAVPPGRITQAELDALPAPNDYDFYVVGNAPAKSTKCGMDMIYNMGMAMSGGQKLKVEEVRNKFVVENPMPSVAPQAPTATPAANFADRLFSLADRACRNPAGMTQADFDDYYGTARTVHPDDCRGETPSSASVCASALFNRLCSNPDELANLTLDGLRTMAGYRPAPPPQPQQSSRPNGPTPNSPDRPEKKRNPCFVVDGVRACEQ